MDRQTSERISSLAGVIENMETRPGLSGATIEREGRYVPVDDFNTLLIHAKSLAGSAMSQDVTQGQHGIHPAPEEFSEAQVTMDPVLHFFHYSHLPEKLQATSRAFFLLAAHVINTVPRNAERTVALRKLLEAKDAAVRANLPAREIGEKAHVASEPTLGEAREIGGDHNSDVPFDV